MAREKERAAKSRLAQAYRAVFEPQTEDHRIVKEDLAMYCRANESEFDPDERIHAFKSGRRDVWIRIQQHLHLSDEALFDLYSGVAVRPMPQTLTQLVEDIEEEENG